MGNKVAANTAQTNKTANLHSGVAMFVKRVCKKKSMIGAV
jgi:hypothetical protein